MTGGQHSIDPHHIQHAQPLLDPIASHRIYHEQDTASLNESPPAVMEGTAFQDFAFPFAGIDQSHLMNMTDISFGNPIGADFTQHLALSSNGPPVTHHSTFIPGSLSSNFGQDPSHCGRSSDVVDDGIGERTSPTEHSFEDAGIDEFGLPGAMKADGIDVDGKKGDDKSSAPPAWSELKTKAGKDRKRLPLACIACRRKKIRCSGEKPACKHCIRSRIPCVYKVTTRKAAPRTDYMAMLDKRLKRMEDRIVKIIPKPDQDATPFVTRAIVKPAVLGSNSGFKPAYKKRGAEEAFGANLESWAKASVHSRGAAHGVDEDPALHDGSISDEHLLSLEGIDALPSLEVQEHLAEVFFDNVYGQAYHLLHKPSYMRKLKSSTLPPVLVLSVCAVAARFATQSNIVGTARPFLRGEEWASHARVICMRRYEWPNVTVLTCLLILGLHEFGTCHGARSWALGGQAIRMAFALQLHKDDGSGLGTKSPASFVDREIRRRIMWACFLMDRFNSCGSDQPMFIKEESIQCQLPVRESYFQLDIPAQTESLDGSVGQSESPRDWQETFPEDNMGAAAYTIRAMAIWGRIVTYLHHDGHAVDDLPLCSEQSTYTRLVQNVEDLQRSLPQALQYSVDNLNLHTTEKTVGQFLLMHLSIQQNALFLHNAAMTWAASNGGQDVRSDFFPRARQKTVAAADSISDILRDAEKFKCNITAPFAGCCAFSATNIHISGIFSGNAAAKATAEVNAGINIKFLQKMARYWGMFHGMVEGIRTQYRNALEASRSGNPCTQSSGEWTWPTLQYTDWFNRYPHGVSDFDDADSTAKRRRGRGDDAVLEQKPELQSVEEYFLSLTSPSSTEGGGPAAHGPVDRRRQTTMDSSESGSKRANHTRTSDASVVQSATSSHKNPRRRATSGQSCASVGGQTNGPAPTGYSSAVPISQVQNQPYAAMSPVSPVQASPYPLPGPGPAPFFGQDISQMNNVDHRGTTDLSQSMDSHAPLEGYSLSGGQTLMDSGVADWQAKHVIDDEVLSHNQQAIKLNSGHSPSHHLHHSQGPMGADGLVDFDGSDVPAGWFMPFSMDPRADFQDMNIPKEGGAATMGVFNPFNSIFGINGMGAHQTMDGLRHVL
ncbi:hypothetical protein E4U41_001622 [Claviceps citrina]|nr:hypothetical protein E4U41_001622 [Claviceps citrina]